MASYIAYPTPHRSSSIGARTVDRFVSICGTIPYALIALLLRLVMARDFFLSGQAKAVGPTLPLSFKDFNFSLILPAQVNDATLHALETPFATGPVTPAIVSYFILYAEFLLPICLVFGFGTRMSALLLLIVTVLSQLYIAPEALWTQHVYWLVILLVLITSGGGAISLDRLIRRLYQK
jgi:putative oxidoreductase